MNRVIFDASTLLISIHKEVGVEAVDDIPESIVMSSVNIAEVVTKMALRGTPASNIEFVIKAYHVSVEPFDERNAMAAGMLVGKTRPFGLSLGDRACLALGLALGLPVITADRAWAQLSSRTRYSSRALIGS